jgi:hypothetical protein
MSDNDKEILKKKIKSAIRVSSQLFIAKKRALGQKIIISEGGKIREIEP